mgnify:FL=1
MLDINRVIPYEQEHDWTCSIACFRTITRTMKSETDLINELHMKPGPYYSDFFYEHYKNNEKYVMKFGCNDTMSSIDAAAKFARLCVLLRDGYSIMLESSYNIAHWMVLVGYLPKGEDVSDCEVLLWDPYLGKYRIENHDEFLAMWYGDNESKVKGDYIAVKISANKEEL